MQRPPRTLLTMALVCAALFVRPLAAEEITLYRDLYGVPHVYAETEPGAAFGIGYAQAEDRLEQILRNAREAEGTLAEAFGQQHVQEDYYRRLEQHRKVCSAKYGQLPSEIRAFLEAYVAGVKAYMAEHPDRVPKWAPELQPWHPIAIARYVIFRWPMGRAMGELERRGQIKHDFYSNEWAVSPKRTADGHAMLLIDPHIGWDGVFRFSEMRVNGGKLHYSGFGPTGTPLIGLGHNRRLGWAFTTGGPDTTDIYALEINPDNPKQYRYDGQWRDLRTEIEEIRVRQDDGSIKTLAREIEYSHHGPIAMREGKVAYAVACPYLDQIDLVTQLYRMCLSQNLDEFNAALEMSQMMEQNCMYADDQGNIQYVRTGRVPIRPKGDIDWSMPVAGNTSKTEWQGIHSQKDLVRLLNPASGYMQNCNIDPATMMRDCPIKPADYPLYVYGYDVGHVNSRGPRAVELLHADADLTTAEAVAIVNDAHAQGAEERVKALLAAAEKYGDDKRVKELAPAFEILKKWNGHLDKDSPAATLFRVWMQHSPRGRGQEGASEIRVLESFAAGVKYLRDNYDRIDVPWGEIHRVARGDKSVPASGGDGGTGMALRAVGADLNGKQLIGKNGQSCTQLVVFKKEGAQSWSVTPWGQCDDPKSPHYFDQAETLFSNSLLKPTWFDRAALEAGNVEAKRMLKYDR